MQIRRISGVLALALAAAASFSAGWLCAGGPQPAWLARSLAWTMGSAADAAPPPFTPPDPGLPGEATILLVGDVLPLQDQEYLAAARPLIAGADVAVCNLECPLSEHGTPCALKLDDSGRTLPREFLFRAPVSQARRLAAAGFDAVMLANNHIMDYGGEALLETLAVLDEAGLRHAGAGPDERAARRPMLLQAGGQRIAILCYVSEATLPGTDGFAATGETAGTVFVGGHGGKPTRKVREMLRADIQAAAIQADYVIAGFHWGSEGADDPGALPRALARCAIDCGADLVVGHHPHVLQGVEIYQGKPIVYSLGNFAFPTSCVANHFSAALEVRLRRGAWTKLVFHPMRIRHRTGHPAPAQGEDLKRVVARLTKLSAALGTKAEAVTDNGGTRVVIACERSGAKGGLLQAEAECFRVVAHPELEGMSTVHFLAWDVQGAGRTARRRSVIVATPLAAEVLAIFRDIYLDPLQFPIHDIVGCTYRTIAGGSGLSNHALGRAIDINRAENPMIRDGEKVVHPKEPPYEPGEWRPGQDPYSIAPDGPVVSAFKARGWRWGGDWTSCKDYQHFEKPPG
ncbi:MAG: CapA family protein [Armatimonadota bacterium]